MDTGPGGPGWNDPPALSYKLHSETTSRRHLLNKRVSYLDHPPKINDKTATSPLDPTSPPPTLGPPKADVKTRPPLDPTGPPPTLGHSPAPKKTLEDEPTKKPELIPVVNFMVPDGAESCKDKSKNEKADDSSAEVLASAEADEEFDWLQKLKELSEKCDSGKEEIMRKIKIAEDMCECGKISKDVRSQMQQLTKHLASNKFDEAWQIHVGLMCDHVSEVRQWMVGIKRLIKELKDES